MAICLPFPAHASSSGSCNGVVAAELKAKGRHLSHAQVEATAQMLGRQADQLQLDPLLILAIIQTESTFDATVVSSHGAQGLMQLLPATARDVARLHGLPWTPTATMDPTTNVRLGALYLSDLRRQFGTMNLALLAYTIGPPALQARLRQANTADVAANHPFVKRVLKRQRALQERCASAPSG